MARMRPTPLGLATPATLLLGFIALASLDPAGLVTRLRDIGFDWQQRLLPRTEASVDPVVVLVEIDQQSLDRLGGWPWPRTRYAELLARAETVGARAVLIEDEFSGPDPTSAAVISRHLEDGFLTAGLFENAQEAGGDHDALLADMLASAQAVLPLHDGSGISKASRLGEVQDNGRFDNALSTVPVTTDMLPFLPEVSQAALPIDALAGEAKALGPDGLAINGSKTLTAGPVVARHIGLLGQIDQGRAPGDDDDASDEETARMGEALASDVLQVVQLHDLKPDIRIDGTGAADRFSMVERNGLRRIAVGERFLPVAPDGSIRLYASPSDNMRRIPAWKVIERQGTESLLKDRLLVIAPTAAGTHAPLVSPLGEVLSPGEVKAMALDQIFAGTFLERPDWAQVLEDALLIGGGLTVLGLFAFGLPVLSLIAGSVLLIGLGAGSWIAFVTEGWLIDYMAPGIALALLTGSVAWVFFGALSSQRAQVLHALGHGLPVQAASSLAVGRDAPTILGGQVRKVTTLLCDMRGSHLFADVHRDDPAWMGYQIQRFHAYLADAMIAAGAVTNVHQGGGVLGFWNAPHDDPDHAKRACDCALKILDGLEAFNVEMELEAEARNKPFMSLNVAAGLNTGHVLVGNLGTDRQIDYSVFGDPVTMVRSLQRYSEVYGSAVIAGEHTYNAVKNRYALLELDSLWVDGRDYGMRAFALMGNPVVRANPRFKALEKAQADILAAYRARNWPVAKERVAAARAMKGAIPALYDFYQKRIAFFETNPPGEGWDGVFRPPIR